MNSVINLLRRINFTSKISILVGLLAMLPITAAVNTSLSFDNFIFQVSFSSSPEDEDDDNQITICEGSSVIFTDTSTDVPEDAVYSWSFPGGSVTSADTPGPHDVTFDAAGTYTVILDINGTTSEMIINVSANPNIEPTIVADGWGQSTFNGATYFTYCSDATSTNPNFEANFAFQTTSTNTTTNSVHTLSDENGVLIYSFTGENFNLPNQFIDHYVNTGFAQVIYQIQEGSCIYNSTFNLYIGASPTATISNEGVPILCTPGDVVYTISPGEQNGPGTVYTIEISDGSAPVVFNHPPPATYTHTYNAVSCGQTDVVFNNTPYPNAFEISITAENACGQSTGGFAPIYIESGPEAQFEFIPNPPNNTICQNVTLTANDTTIEGSNITSDGECNDFYKRFWQITAPNGLVLSSASNGSLDPNTYANVVGHMGYVPGGIDINAESASNWSNNAANSIDITFSQPGNYEVTLFTGSSGQSNRCGITSYTQVICVTPEVVADFDLSTYTVCGPATITTVNNSSLTGCDNQNIYEWTLTYENLENCPIVQTPNWEFVNGTDASSFEPEFQFNTPGVYEISLTVSLDTNTIGTSCEPDTKVKFITIKEKPQTTLPTLELCESESYTFNLDVFNCYADQDATFLWDFQGASGLTINDESILNPTVTFANAGSYPYTLTLTNECGNNQLSGTIEVYPEVLISVSGPDVICVNLDIDLNGIISGGASTGLWSASIVGGSFLPSTNSLNTIYTPPADFAGSIVFTLTSEDPFGPCPAVSDVVEVNVQPEATVDAGTYDPFCINTPIQLVGSIGGAATSATWSANVSGVFSPSPNDLNAIFTPDTADFVGNISFTLTTDDPAGPCLSSIDEVTVTVNPEPVVVDQTVEVCSDEALGYTIVGDVDTPAVATYNLTSIVSNGLVGASGNQVVADGLLSDALTADVWTNETSSNVDVVYTLVPIGDNGCEGDPFTVTVTVNPEPVVVDQTVEVCSDEALGYTIVGDVDTPAVATYNLTSIVSNGLVGASGNQVVADGLLSDALTADVWTNETSSNVDVVYTLVPIGDNGCEGDPFTVTLTVNPEPVVVDQTVEVCSDEALGYTIVGDVDTPLVATYNLTSIVSNGLVGASGNQVVADGLLSDALTADVWTNETSSNVDVVYTLVPIGDNGCEGDPFTVTVTVNPEPVVVDQTVEVCSDEALGIDFDSSSSVAATSYEITALTLNGLTVSSGGAGLGGGLSSTDLSDDAFTNTTPSPVDVVYTVVPSTSVGCEGDPFTVTVTVNPEPVVADQTVEVCSDEALGYTIVGDVDTPAVATYNLTSIVSNGLVGASGNQVVADGLLSDALTADVWTNETSSNVDVVYTLVPIGDNGCEGDPFTVTVTVNPEPVVVDQTVEVCSDEALGYTIVGDVDTPLVATYNLTSIVSNGLVGASGNQVVADGLLSDALTADVWTNETSSNVDVVYTLVPIGDNGCEGDPFTVTVTVNPEPVVVDQTVEVCSDEALGIDFDSSSSVAATSYEITALTLNGLTVSSGGAGLGGGLSSTDLSDDAFTNTTPSPVDVVYTVVPSTSVGCEGDPFTVTVTVNPEPVVVDQTLVVCSDEALGYTIVGDVDTPLVATYNLTSIVSNGLVGASGNQVVADGLLSDALTADVWTNETSSNVDVVYTLVPIGDNGCEGDPFTVTVTVNPEPVVVDQTVEVCSDEALGYTIVGDVDTPLVATYNLTSIVSNGLVGASGNQVVADGLLSDALTADVWTNETSSNVDVVYTLVPIGDNGCEGDPFTVTVTVNPEPVVVDQTVEVCSDEALGIDFDSSSSVAATSYEITALTLNGLTVSSGGAGLGGGLSSTDLSDDAFTNTTPSPVDVVYTVVPSTSVGCEGDPFTVTVTVNPEPVVVDQTVEVCSDEALGYTIVGDVDTPLVATYNLTSIVSNGLVGASGNQVVADGLLSDALTADVWTNETSSNVDVVYTLVPIGDNGCEGDPFTVTVTVNPEPVGISSIDSIISNIPFDFDLQNYIDNSTISDFSWLVTSITGVDPNDISGVNIGDTQNGSVSGTVENISGNTACIIYTIFYSSNLTGCFGNPFTLTLCIDSEPVVADQTVEVCSDEALGIEFGSNSSVAATSYEITALTLNGLTVSSGGAGLGGGLFSTDLSDDAFTNTTPSPVDVVYTVVPFNNATPGNPFTVTVTVNPEPVVVDQTLVVCSDEALGYTIVGDVDTPAVATYNLTSIVSNGLVGASGNQVVADGLLSDALTADVWTNETSSNVDVVYTLVPIGDNGCEGDPFTVTLTVNPEPVVVDQTVEVCSDEALGYTIVGDVDTPAVATYNLTSIVSNGLVGASGNQVVADGLLSDALTADVWTNETSSNVDVVYTLVPIGDNGCEGDPFTVTVTVNPEPVVVDQTVEVCSDEALGIDFDSSSSVAATSYEITALTLNGLTVSSGGAGLGGGLSSTDLSDDAFTNTTPSPVDVVYTVVPSTSVGCEGDPFTVTVTVNPEPVVADQTVEVCSDEALGYTIVGDVDTPAVATYNLTSIVSNGLVGASGNQVVADGLLSDALTADVWTNETSSNVDVVYTLVPIGDNGCEGDPFTVTVTVNPEPVVVDQTVEVCSDEALGYTIVGDVDTPLVATYNLTSIVSNGLVGASGNQVVADGLLSDALTADVWTNETSSNVDVVYTLVPIGDNGCEGDPFTVTVTVNPEPVVVDQTVEVCSDEALGIDFDSSSSVAATSYEITALTLNGLTVSSGGAGLGGGLSSTDLSDDAFTNTTPSPVDVVYTVVPSTSVGCEGDPFTVTVTVNPEPVVVDQTLVVCSDEALGYTIVGDVDTPLVATYNLTSIVSNGLVGASGNQVVADGLLSDALTADVWTNETSSNVDVVYTLVPIGDNGCEGDPFTVTVTVNPEPVVVDQTVEVCSDEALGIDFDSSSSVAATSYEITALTLNGLTVSSGGAGLGGGLSSTDLSDDAFTNTTPSPVDVVYTVVPSTSVGCEGDPFTVTVTVNPEPVVVDQTVEVCSDEALGIDFDSSSSVAATSYEITALTLNGLTVSSGGAGLGGGLSSTDLSDDAFTNTTPSPVDVVYTVVPSTSVGCEGDPFTVTLTVNPEPVVADQTVEVCSDEALGYTIVGDVDTPAVATYNLTSIVSNGLVGASGNQVVADGLLSDALTADVWTNETSSNVDVVYTLVPIGDNGCEGDPFTVTVTVNPEPVVVDQTVEVCSDEALGIDFDSSSSVAATSYEITALTLNGLTVSSGGAGLGGGLSSTDLSDDAFTNTTPSPVDVVYTVVPSTSVGCEGDPFTVTVTVNPEPVVVDQTVEVCSDEALGIDFDSSSSVAATSYEITALTLNGLTVSSGGAGLGGGLSSTDLSDDAFTNTTPSPVDVVYTVVPSTSVGCEGDPFTVTVTVNPEPVVVDQTLVVCSDEALGYTIVGDVDTPLVATYNLTSIVSNGLVGASGNQVVADGLLSDALTADVWTNETSSNVDVVYTLVPIGDNGCEGDPFTVTLTVNPEPVVVDQTVEVCSDEALGYTIVGDVDTPLVATYNLTSIVSNGLVGASGNQVVADGLLSDALTADVWTNETSSNVDVVYTLVPIGDNGCEGDPFTVTVTVNPEPVVVDQTVEVCSDEALGIDFDSSSSVAATSYEITALTLNGLTVSSGGAGLGGGLSSTDLSDDAFTNTTPSPVDVVYTVVPSTSVGCEGDPFTVTVTVNPEPVVADQTLVVCSDEALGYTIVGDVDTPAVATYNLTSIVSNGLVGASGNQVVADGLLSDALTADVWTNETSSNVDVVYTLVPIGDNGCEGDPFTVTVTVNPEPVVVDQTVEVCSDEALGYTIVGDVDTPAVATYNLTSIVSNGLVGASGNQVVADGLLSDALTADVWTNETSSNVDVVYTLVPIGDNGCEGDPFTVTLTVNPEPVVVDQTVEVCSDEALGYTIVGDVDTPLVATYNLTSIVSNGLVGASGNQVVADGLLSDALTADVWTNETSSNVDVVYTLVPIGDNGCEGDPFTVTVTVSPEPKINEVITNISCSYSDPLCGASIEINPTGIGPFTYSWVSIEGNPLNDPTDEDQFDLCPGTYELTITDASSCSYVFEYEIVPPEPVEFTLITQTDISCNNVNTLPCDGSIEVSTTGGTLPYNLVEWYTETIPGSGVFDSGPLINIINPYNLVNACEGNYVLKILDVNGCEFVSDVYTIEQAVESIILTETLSNYNGYNVDCNAANSGTITVDLSGGSGVFIYSFENAIGNILEANTILSSPATLVFDFLIAGDYTLTVEDPNCTDQIVRNYTLTQPDELIITATLVDPVSCFGGLATYNVTATGGVPPYTGTGLQSVLSGPVTFIVSDANGCEDDFSTVVNEPTELLATYVVDDAPCFGDTGQITVTPTGGTGVLTVNLYDNNNIFITSLNTTQGNSVTFDQLAATYFYDVVDENNCSYGPEVVEIDEPDPVVIIDFEVIQPDCNTVPAWEFNNGSICITITGGTNPFPIGTGWVDNGGGQWCLDNLSAGTYPIDVTDINNCLLQNSIPDITLVRPPEITAVLTNTTDIDCDTDTATQINTIIVNGGVPPYQITWSGGIVDAANPFVMETSVPGNYSAFVIDQYGLINGCPPIEFPLDPITFFEFGIADFTLSSDNSAFCGIYAINDPIQFNNISTGDIVSYNWNFGDGSPEFNGPNAPDHTYNAIGTYTISLTVEDLYGCFDTYSETIEITKGYEIILPNGFTPNGDGINETIRPVTICMTEIKMSIYDTWGSLIYAETSDDIYGWDGTIDGKPAENGNYIMVVIATTYNGAVIELNGPVTLIK